MRAKASVRMSLPDDCTKLSPNLRLADRREVIACSGKDVSTGLKLAQDGSDKCWTVTLEGEPIALFGYVQSTVNSSANIWLLGSDKIKTIKWQFLRESRKWLKQIVSDFDRVWAIADVRNSAHRDWYEWLGFKVTTTVDWGPFKLPFYHIEYLKEESDV